MKLLDAIGDLELGKYLENDIDTFSDAYEYLMTMYASSAGKSAGKFFTQQGVSELTSRLTVLGKTRVGMVCKNLASGTDDNWQKLPIRCIGEGLQLLDIKNLFFAFPVLVPRNHETWLSQPQHIYRIYFPGCVWSNRNWLVGR